MKLYFKILLLVFFSANFHAYSQSLQEKLNNSRWYTAEGLEFRFNDSTITFGGLKNYEFFPDSIPILWEDSTIVSFSEYISDDNLITQQFKEIIAKVTYTNDSLIMKFSLKRIMSDNRAKLSVFHEYFTKYFKNSTIVFYSQKRYNEIKGKFNLLFEYNTYHYNLIKIDKLGRVVIQTDGVEQYSDSLFFDGIYKGRLKLNAFEELKTYISDSLIRINYNKDKRYFCDDCACNNVMYETDNLNIKYFDVCYGSQHSRIFSKLTTNLYKNNAWVGDTIKFYGYDIKNKVSLSKQLVYNNFSENKEFVACSGLVELKKTVKNRRQTRYIYELIVDSIHDNPKRKTIYPEFDTVYVVSNKMIKNPDSIGCILKPTFIDNGKYIINYNYFRNRKTFFYQLRDTFSLDTNYIFLFNKSSYSIRSGYPKNNWWDKGKYQSKLNFKISREILKLQGKFYY